MISIILPYIFTIIVSTITAYVSHLLTIKRYNIDCDKNEIAIKLDELEYEKRNITYANDLHNKVIELQKENESLQSEVRQLRNRICELEKMLDNLNRSNNTK